MRKIIIGFTLIAITLLSTASYPLFELSNEKQEPKNVAVSLLVTCLGTFSAFTLWVWMLLDFRIKKRDIKHATLWCFGLFIMNWAAAAVYFIAIYFPRQKETILL